MNRPQKRSFQIRGHRTSLSLEQPFWEALREIADSEEKTLAGLVAEIDAKRNATASGLSGAIRIFILDHYRRKCRDVL
ncbi:MAG: ribbon-helix-helix domain-containing protein [Alphaproteobacteria bacterium]|nr:ribbon-helix-helix domain-containing protein [Alphaproteobacteria bacterium]